MRAHPWLTAPEADVFPTGPNVMAQSEALLGALRAGGLPDRAAAVTVHLLPLFVIAFVRDEVGGLSGHDAPPEQVLDQIGAYFAGLPADRYPNYAALGPLIVGIEWNERFELMLDVLIAGLSALAR
jgi:hypothetical protein